MEPKRNSRLEAVRAALTAAGVEETAETGLVSTYDLTRGSEAQRRFHAEIIDGNLDLIYSESWPTDETEIGSDARFRESTPWESVGVFQSRGALALAALFDGSLHLTVAANSRDEIADAVSAFRSRFPFTAPPTDSLVPVTFWSLGRLGPQSYTRRVDVQPWDEIEQNYTAAVRAELGRLMTSFEPGKGGQLLLWQGPPGTGKTWALRALASEWRDWAELHYVTDPDAFFGEHASYMVEVLLRESFSYDVPEGADPLERWRLLVLEDTGELLSSDAKEKSGQALSRLLNVVDGLIGQGLRVLVLVTTNDELDGFHPAVSRPGRCASAIEFAPLTAEEVADWTGDADAEPATLADLYAIAGTDPSLTSAASSNLGGTVKPENALAADAVAPVTDVRPDAQPEAVVELPEQRTNAAQIRWEGVLVAEDTLTEDRRYIMPGATSWRALPLSLAAMLETEDGHDGAEVCGRIDEIWREGNLIMGRGVFDDSEFGQQIAAMVENRTLRGNSVDLAVKEYEIAPATDFDENGHRIAESEFDPFENLFDAEADSNPVVVFRDCVIGMSTVCPFPAFADANIVVLASAIEWRATRQAAWTITRTAPRAESAPPELRGEEPPAPVEAAGLEGLTASAAGLAPLKPPAAWFDAPDFSELTPLTVTDDGRLSGHFAAWGTCHIGIPDVCVEPPSSLTNYAYFHLGEIETEEGDRVSVGHITLDAPHAAKHLGRQAATEHYDHTGYVVADVVAGEDEFGPWVAGALRPDVPATRVRELTAAVLSGDWRNVNGNLELVGLLAVNVPGFPVPRALVAAAEGGARVLSLVAAGVVARKALTRTEEQRLSCLATVAGGGLEALAARAA